MGPPRLSTADLLENLIVSIPSGTEGTSVEGGPVTKDYVELSAAVAKKLADDPDCLENLRSELEKSEKEPLRSKLTDERPPLTRRDLYPNSSPYSVGAVETYEILGLPVPDYCVGSSKGAKSTSTSGNTTVPKKQSSVTNGDPFEKVRDKYAKQAKKMFEEKMAREIEENEKFIRDMQAMEANLNCFRTGMSIVESQHGIRRRRKSHG